MSNVKSRVLTRGNAIWRLSRLTDTLFRARNSYGKTYEFDSQFGIESFEDYLLDKGFALREPGSSLSTLKHIGAE